MRSEINPDVFRLHHDLNPIFDSLKAFRHRRDYERSDLFRDFGEEIRRIEEGVEWKNTRDAALNGNVIRVAAWNVERGKNLDGIIDRFLNDPVLSKADILLLSETDIGMGRSGNRNVPLELADALGMNYCFANSFLVLAKGDAGEQGHEAENSLSLHGVSILSRFKFMVYDTVPLPGTRDAFYSKEKRLGQRRALGCTVRIGSKAFDFCVLHLEVHSSPRQRAEQMAAALKMLSASTSDGKLVGGDLNTSTYNLASKFRLAGNLLYKFLFVGFKGTIGHYMTPERLFEKPLFETFAKYGFDYRDYNDLNAGTLYFDVNDQVMLMKSNRFVPDFSLRWLGRKLEPWNGCVPLRLDWLAGRGLAPLGHEEGVYGPPRVIDRPLWQGEPISDHNPIVVDLKV